MGSLYGEPSCIPRSGEVLTPGTSIILNIYPDPASSETSVARFVLRDFASDAASERQAEKQTQAFAHQKRCLAVQDRQLKPHVSKLIGGDFKSSRQNPWNLRASIFFRSLFSSYQSF